MGMMGQPYREMAPTTSYYRRKIMDHGIFSLLLLVFGVWIWVCFGFGVACMPLAALLGEQGWCGGRHCQS
jgi:hypothetical protein